MDVNLPNNLERSQNGIKEEIQPQINDQSYNDMWNWGITSFSAGPIQQKITRDNSK